MTGNPPHIQAPQFHLHLDPSSTILSEVFPLVKISGLIGNASRQALHVRADEKPKGNSVAPSLPKSSRQNQSIRFLVFIGLAYSVLGLGARADESAATTNSVERLKSLTLEDVLNTPITSVSKRSENSFQAAAAVSVISHDDIARSGARSIPEALRLAPGMTIASMDSHTWAVSSRGLTDLLSDRLLVLIDGRTIYTPLFSGVFWDLQSYPLEDIDRIEVIRGPGGTLWGANAVNGVVNIITRNSKETLGTYFTSGVGTVERAFFDARYGAALSDDLTARAYFSGYKRENFQGGFDDSQNLQGGFRTDWSRDQTTLTLQGDYYHNEGDQRVIYGTYAGYVPNQGFPMTESTFPGDGGNILGRFFHSFSEDSDVQLQAYYDRVNHDFLGTQTLQEIYNVEWQQRFNLPLNQNLIYGLGYRYLPDSVTSGKNFIPVPNSLGRQDFNGFIQDEVPGGFPMPASHIQNVTGFLLVVPMRPRWISA
jgi:iron complex outermembrane receptor protein